MEASTGSAAEAPAAGQADLALDAAVAESLAQVRAKVEAAAESRGAGAAVRLVAVSKTKPAEAVMAAYRAGHRHFGENYVQEVIEKAPALPGDVRWHFIGTLQSNKVGALVKGAGPALACVETVTSEKLALALGKAAEAASRSSRLQVMVQVNSSGEESKNGVTAEECVPLARFITTECPALEFIGLMTIGAPDYSGCRTEDFELMHRLREDTAQALGCEPTRLELSMGMSNDFDSAIVQGSTSVRVGSAIFGARDYSAKR